MDGKDTMNGAGLNNRYDSVTNYVPHNTDQVTKENNEEIQILDTNDSIRSLGTDI